MTNLKLFEEKVKAFLPEYEVGLGCLGEGGKEFLAEAEITVADRENVDGAVWDAVGMILTALRSKIESAFPSDTFHKVYIYPPAEWTWRHGDQAGWGPSRWFCNRDGANVKLCMGFMVKGEK